METKYSSRETVPALKKNYNCFLFLLSHSFVLCPVSPSIPCSINPTTSSSASSVPLILRIFFSFFFDQFTSVVFLRIFPCDPFYHLSLFSDRLLNQLLCTFHLLFRYFLYLHIITLTISLYTTFPPSLYL